MSDDQLPDEAQLLAMLDEDLGGDAGDLLETVQRLRRWKSPQPDAAITAQLVSSLAVELQPSAHSWRRSMASFWPLLLLRSQLRVVRSELLLASALVITLGTLVTLVDSQVASKDMLPLVLLAPVMSALALAFIYDDHVIQMLELEDTTPVSLRVLLLARLTLVFCFNLLLMLLASLGLVLVRNDISLWPLIASWLAPMTFLSALAFFMSVVLKDALVGALISLLLWVGHVGLRAYRIDNELLRLLTLPGLTAPSTRPLLLVSALLLAAVALWVAGMSERYLGGAR